MIVNVMINMHFLLPINDLPDEIVEVYLMHASQEEQIWQLFFKSMPKMGSRGSIIAEVGVVLLSPWNYMIPFVFLLT